MTTKEDFFMKFCKNLCSYLPTIPDADPCFTSAAPGSTNCLIFDNGSEKFCKVWDSGAPDVDIAVIAHGFSTNGRIAIIKPDIPTTIVGTGKNAGFALFIQRLGDVFSIALCQDDCNQHERFFMTATKSVAITGIILTLVDRWLAPVEKGKLSSFLEDIIDEN